MITAGLRRYGKWRRMTTGCTALVHSLLIMKSDCA